jgi:hypothetical protein
MIVGCGNECPKPWPWGQADCRSSRENAKLSSLHVRDEFVLTNRPRPNGVLKRSGIIHASIIRTDANSDCGVRASRSCTTDTDKLHRRNRRPKKNSEPEQALRSAAFNLLPS